MNKHIERIKKQAKDEVMRTGLIVIGTVGGMLSAKGLDKLTTSHPTINAILKYAYPILLAGGGFIIASATEEKSKSKYFGYGLIAAGTIEGVKIIPVVKDYLHGILGDTEVSAANAFLTESEERQKLMSGFGTTSLPIGKASLQNANTYETNLPELENPNEEPNEELGLGFNPSATDDADMMRGIL